jgi:hypothetical protein
MREHVLRSLIKPRLRESEPLPAPLKTLLACGQTTGKTGKIFRDLNAASTESNLVLLQQLLRDVRPATTLEVGMGFATSTFVFASYQAQNQFRSIHGHIAIDPFQRTFWDSAGEQFLEAQQLNHYVHLLPTFSSSALPALLTDGKRVDLAYIDGSHLFEDVFVDFYFINQLLQTSGYLLFDDSTHPDVRKVISFIRRNLATHYRIVDLRAYYAPSWRNGLRHTLVQHLRRNQLTCFRKTAAGRRPWDARLRDF